MLVMVMGESTVGVSAVGVLKRCLGIGLPLFNYLSRKRRYTAHALSAEAAPRSQCEPH